MEQLISIIKDNKKTINNTDKMINHIHPKNQITILKTEQ